MLTQCNDSRFQGIVRHAGSSFPILRAALCAVLVFCAAAQAQSHQSTFTHHHFSGASAIATYGAANIVAATMVNADPVPIPGGINVPPVIHIWAPGLPESAWAWMWTNPLDPSYFAGEFRNAIATANFTVFMNGVTFTIKDASSKGVFAEAGKERNGVFLNED